MPDYIEREAVCYQLAKQATIDGQPRAIRRAAKIVADFPAADVRPVVTCADCKHWARIKKDCILASCDLDALVRCEDFYCANGEKREES